MKNISTKKKDILAAAAKIFGEKGLDNSSLDEVAAEAGVAKGTIFYYFSGKEELFSSLIEEGIDILSGQIKEIIQKKISTKEKLDKIINSHFLFFKQNRNICLMILGQLGNFQKRWKKGVGLIQDKYIPVLTELIEECKKADLIDKSLNSEAIIVNLFSLLAISSIDWAIFHSKISENEISNLTRRMITNGLKKI